jgi:hypothetical protein
MMRDWIFVPVIIQVFLTLFVYLRLLQVKKRAATEGRVDRVRVALRDDAWPDYVIQVNNNIRNQFELPVLFFGVCFILWGLEAVGVVALVLAWLFVVSRIAHTWIHLTSNYIPNRRRLFTVGWWILLAMMLLVVWQLAGRAITAV